MLKVKIMVFKNTGKFYTGGIATNEVDIPLWKDEFKEFIKNNIPVRCMTDGYIVVEDIDDGEGFHVALYKSEELL